MSSGELQEALEAVLASNEDPFPSIQEVAQRLGYHSKGPSLLKNSLLSLQESA